MPTILITGANGQLGSSIKKIKTEFQGYNFIFTDVAEMDITSERSVNKYFTTNKVNYLVNCAAYTAVDKAEDEKDLANRINMEAVRNLAFACKKFNTRFIHISTDYVFNGKNHLPYKEDNDTDPIGYYGYTKLEGEKVLQIIGTNYLIIRTSWLYSEFGTNFVKTILRLLSEKPELKVIYDQVGTPTYAEDLARAIMQIIASGAEFNNQLYHFSNEGAISWYDFAKSIARISGKTQCKIYPIESFEYPTKTKRPHYSVLNKAKIKKDFSLSIPYWEDSLIKCLKVLNSK